MAKKNSNGANLGFEAELWKLADALRSNMDAAEYKHVVLGLIFLKYISDAFEEQHAKLEAERADGADPEDPDEYQAANVFWVPQEARWSHLRAHAKQPDIGKIIDNAMIAIERDNPSCSPRITPALRSTNSGSVSSLTSSGTSASATAKTAQRTSSAAYTSTSSPSLRALRARKAASSTRRAVLSGPSSR